MTGPAAFQSGATVASGPDLLGTSVALRAADGHALTAYRVEPEGAPRGGLVILQEIFGVNRHIREVCDGYARHGYAALSPALYDRVRRGVGLEYDAEGIAAGRSLRAAVGWDGALLDLQAAIDAIGHAGPVAVIGYCWGGTLAFLAATRLEGLRCAVGYYGGQTVPFAQERPRVPVMMHFGELDPRIPAADREIIRRANPEIEMHLFPADHGFNCDHRREWHAPSAARALKLTLTFLERHLGSAGATTERNDCND